MRSAAKSCREVHALLYRPRMQRRDGTSVPVLAPKGIEVREEGEGGRLVIVRRWYGRAAYVVLGFGVVWTVGGVLAITHGEEPSSGLAAVVWLGFVSLGVLIAYAGICRFVNRTEITVDADTVSVRHAPLPGPNAPTLAIREIEALVCEERRGEDHSVFSHHLTAQLRGGRRVRLLEDVQDADEVAFVRERVERFLRGRG